MLEALSFLTPLGGARLPTKRAMWWFPLVGLLLGLLLGGIWWLASLIWPPPLAAAVVVALDLAMTGMLHLDGLIDSADGLLSQLERQRRLEVMRDPSAGAFGVGAAIIMILMRWVALSSMHPAPLLLASLWCISRSSMALTANKVPYARAKEGGIASAFIGSGLAIAFSSLVWIGAAMLLALTWSRPQGVGADLAELFSFSLVVYLSVKRLGGFTGDVLGAAGMVGETLGLIVAVIR